MVASEKPHGVAVAVISQVHQRTGDAFPPLVLLLSPAPCMTSWSHALGLLSSHPLHNWSLGGCLLPLRAGVCLATQAIAFLPVPLLVLAASTWSPLS